MVSVERVTGRLFEIRFSAPARRGEFDELDEAMRKHLADLHALPVICMDLRGASVLDPLSTALVIERMRVGERRFEREALLLPADNAIVEMQTERLLRAAPLENRRAFRSAAELATWLDDVLTARERARLIAFLCAVRPLPKHHGSTHDVEPSPPLRRASPSPRVEGAREEANVSVVKPPAARLLRTAGR
ncbi:Hypothetical protein A7982_08698 [Minicystis rosea]|nr:Hypothetical protein A7982_08698 [Minicystis rosea]